jgi:hypothetical protein
MILLNFAHPITDEQRAQIAARTRATIERVIVVPTQIDNAAQLVPQVVALADACDLSPHEWQTLDLLVNPPGFAPVAVALIAEIHGRRGTFPKLVHIRPAATGTGFEVAEIIDLRAIREVARTQRWMTQE